MTLKLMRGVIQAPPDERKREQKPGYKSKKKRSGKGGDEASFSDSVDEYGAEDDITEYRKNKNIVVAVDGSEMTTLNPGAISGTDGEFIDADGYRRDKHGKLIRPKGMSDKEWKRLQREEELKRMQHLAHNFNYYAMDGKDNL